MQTTRRSPLVRLVTVLGIVAILAVGCGSDSSEQQVTAQPPAATQTPEAKAVPDDTIPVEVLALLDQYDIAVAPVAETARASLLSQTDAFDRFEKKYPMHAEQATGAYLMKIESAPASPLLDGRTVLVVYVPEVEQVVTPPHSPPGEEPFFEPYTLLMEMLTFFDAATGEFILADYSG